jgi:cytochrome oxidase Cu insertion factor (SCO1/SenC/PrrC family)
MRRVLLGLALLTVVFLLLLAGLAFRGGWSSKPGRQKSRAAAPARYLGSQPPSGIRLPPLKLRDYRGVAVDTRSLRAGVVLVTFLDTGCKTKCPIVAAVIGSGLRLLSRNERRQVSPIAISVDPPLDTPRRVRLFLSRRHALALDYLTGRTRQLRPVWKAFGVLSAVETGNADIHSSDVRIFDRRRVWVSTLHAGVDLTPRALAHDIEAALEVPR